MLNVSEVHAFVVVAEQGSFVDAARILQCAQPTVSKMLVKLETDLGTALIIRGGARSSLSPAGERFLPFAKALLGAEERARTSLVKSTATVAASGNIGTYFLPGALAKAKQSSDLRVDISITTNPQIADGLRAGHYDVGAMEWWDERPGFDDHIWLKDELVVIVNNEHRWARRSSVESADLFDQPMLGGEAGSGTATVLRNALGKAASDVKVSQSLGSTEAVKRAVISGMGISLVLKGSIIDEVKSGALIQLPVRDVRLEKTFHLIVPSNLPPNAPGRCLVESLMA